MKNRTSRIDKVVWRDLCSSNIPDDLGNLLLIVGCPNPKWVVLECPCGCKSRIDVNLMRTRSPRWRLGFISTEQFLCSRRYGCL